MCQDLSGAANPFDCSQGQWRVALWMFVGGNEWETGEGGGEGLGSSPLRVIDHALPIVSLSLLKTFPKGVQPKLRK